MKTYIYIAEGYSYGGWGGYKKITVAQCKGSPSRSWTNGKMEILEQTGRLFCGSSLRCEYQEELQRILKEYKNSKIL